MARVLPAHRKKQLGGLFMASIIPFSKPGSGKSQKQHEGRGSTGGKNMQRRRRLDIVSSEPRQSPVHRAPRTDEKYREELNAVTGFDVDQQKNEQVIGKEHKERYHRVRDTAADHKVDVKQPVAENFRFFNSI